MKIAIIGGGAGGLMAGGFLSEKADVTIFDGNEKCGKKIYITGKGRCNLTNNCTTEEFLLNVVHGNKFMMSAINGFNSQDTIDFFENLGMKTITERGKRVFPFSQKSSDVIKALEKHSKNCKINLSEKVLSITKQEENFIIKTSLKSYQFDRVIIATGGKSYPATGSTGDGYKFAKTFGHSIVKPCPALVPIRFKDKMELEGLSLKNVTLKAKINGKDKELFGEMLFTGDGISGPIALSMSSYIGENKVDKLSIDFKPALTEEILENRVLRDMEENKNKNFSYILKGLLPIRMANEFIKRLNISEELKVNSVKTETRKSLIKLLKDFPLQYAGLYPIEAGIVTSGGVDLKEVNPKTMESKLVKGLYFIGEVLDIDCLTGGFNLQTAFSTAYACAKYIEKE